ncbi:hypothetical protein AL518_20805 [Hafnia paralvei]|nr:hypothetical protein AL518_20805 [Hafnia paralvei]PNK68263.1 hypothetical protein A6J69_015025 [Hafnia paralvei]RDA64322.1 hypothetical protein DU449_14205 [Hafnia paralvei]RDA65037.1 hypothetical protein DVH08_17055 [Hafnia paralvei]RDA66011.1 hypothetical protein DVH09_14760 [Hafnia paralvei]
MPPSCNPNYLGYKRLVVKLQKPYKASSGIVSILAVNQSTNLTRTVITRSQLTLFSDYTWGQSFESQSISTLICDACHKNEAAAASLNSLDQNRLNHC